MAELKPFDPKATCPKCGGEDVGCTYEEGPHFLDADCSEDEEHLHRYCRTCGYDWPEACKEEGRHIPEGNPRCPHGRSVTMEECRDCEEAP